MAAKSFEVVHLDPDQVHFERHGDTLSLTLADGTHYPRVVLRSCFPLSEGERLLSVRDASLADDEQPEIGIIEDWARLKGAGHVAVAAELSLYYFMPKIKRVSKVKDELGFLYWTVDTDKGSREFVMRNRIVHHAREVSPGHWLLIDVNQARYEIPDLDQLDQDSQKLVKRFLCI